MAFNSIWGGISKASHSYSLSMESFGLEDDIVNPNTGDVVGDADTEIAEMATESAEISAGVDEVQRVSNAADVGETVAEAAQSVQERGDASPEEAALIQAGAAQTFAGMGATTADVVDGAQEVASESNGKYNIATEGFVDKLKAAWQAIKDFVAKLIRKAKEFINRLWNSTASVLKKAKKLKEILKEKSDEKKKDTIESWHGFFNQISETTSGRFNPSNLVVMYNKYGTLLSGLFGNIKDNVAKMCTEVSSNPNNAFDFDKIATRLGKQDVSKYLGKNYVGSISDLPLGNKTYVKGYSDSKDITLIAKINSITHRVVDASKEFSPKKKDIKISVYTHDQINGVIDAVENVINTLDDWYNKESKATYKSIDEMQGLIDKTIKESNEAASPTNKENHKVHQRCFVATTQDVRGSIDLCTQTIKVSNAMLSFAALMINQYENKKDK